MAFLPVSLVAGLFSSESDGGYTERKSAIIAPSQVDDFEKVLEIRKDRIENERALNRLFSFKQSELAGLDAAFKSEYGMRNDRQYAFDITNSTIYYISYDSATGGSSNAPVRLPHRVFPTVEERNVFFAALQAKKELDGQISVLRELIAENDAELKKIKLYLLQTAGVGEDHDFRYDRRSHAVYEFVPLPPKKPEPTPEEKAYHEAVRVEEEKAKIRAEKIAREEAERRAEEDERIRKEAERQLEEEHEAKEKRLKEEREAEERRQEEVRAVAEAKAREEARVRKEAERKAEKARKAEEKRQEEARKAEEKRQEEARKAEEKRQEEARKAEELRKKEAEKKAWEYAVLAEVRKLTAERSAAIKAAQTDLDKATGNMMAATAELAEARKDFEWAKANRKDDKTLLSQRKNAVNVADAKVDAAEDALDDAKKALKSAKNKLDDVHDDAEDNVKAAMKAAAKKAAK